MPLPQLSYVYWLIHFNKTNQTCHYFEKKNFLSEPYKLP